MTREEKRIKVLEKAREKALKKANKFNNKHSIGTNIIYYSYILDDGSKPEGFKTKTRSKAFVPEIGYSNDDSVCIFLEGITGYVLFDFITICED